MEISLGTLQANTINEVNSLKTQMSTVPHIIRFGQGLGQREEHIKLKPITEYKAISELANLGKGLHRGLDLVNECLITHDLDNEL